MKESRTLGSLVEPSNGFGLSILIPVGKLVPLVYYYTFYIGTVLLNHSKRYYIFNKSFYSVEIADWLAASPALCAVLVSTMPANEVRTSSTEETTELSDYPNPSTYRETSYNLTWLNPVESIPKILLLQIVH